MTTLSPIRNIDSVAAASGRTPTGVSPAAGVSTARSPGLSTHLRQRIARDFHARWSEEWGSKFVTHGRTPGRDAIRLDGNDYLAVTGHPRIVQAQIDNLR